MFATSFVQNQWEWWLVNGVAITMGAAVIGNALPLYNPPLRVAEEFAMLDTMTGGRVIAGMLRGTSNEYVTYGTNPAESRVP